jgi:hypothetical protein
MTNKNLQRPDDGDWVVVGYATGMAEADIIAGLLRAFKIPVFVHQEAAARAIGITIGMGMIKILVPAQFEGAAFELLEADEKDDPSNSLDGPQIIFPEEG